MAGRGLVTGFLAGCADALIRHNRSDLAAWLRRRRYRTSCQIDTGVIVSHPAHFSAGDGCALYHGTYVLNTDGRLIMGEHCHLGAYCYVNVARGTIVLGSGVAIGPGTRIIAYSNHYRAGRLVAEERITADIRIGSNVFVGANCVILPGSTIADNVVVGAGSVVRGELETNAIYAGAPARKIREGWYG
ncbi:MAG TPA: acyltransferase [Longimicrobiales bacterium]|nr:acyltransferase [Longimicrobiales bacterium]